MKNCSIFPIVSFIICLSSFSADIAAQNAEDYFKNADAKYSSGDLDGAIIEAEKALKLDKSNEFYKNFLGLCLNESGNKYYNEKNYEKAMPYFKKMLNIYPDDRVTKGLYDLCRRKMGLPDETITPPPSPPPQVEKKVQRGYIFAAGAFLILLTSTFILLKKSLPVKDVPTVKISAEAELEDKIQAIEAIASQTFAEEDKEISRRLLSGFLSDNSTKVKCRAILALYKASPLEATDRLKSMLADKNADVRIEAVRTLKHLLPMQSVRILIELVKTEVDKEVRRNIIHTLYEFARDKKSILPDETLQEIITYLKNAESKEKWIIR